MCPRALRGGSPLPLPLPTHLDVLSSRAQAAGLPSQYMEDAIRLANSMAVARAEMEQDYVRLEGAPRPADG